MTHLEKAQSLMARALNIKPKNREFAERLFREAQQEMLKAQKMT